MIGSPRGTRPPTTIWSGAGFGDEFSIGVLLVLRLQQFAGTGLLYVTKTWR
jgi:hypothetical protein